MASVAWVAAESDNSVAKIRCGHPLRLNPTDLYLFIALSKDFFIVKQLSINLQPFKTFNNNLDPVSIFTSTCLRFSFSSLHHSHLSSNFSAIVIFPCKMFPTANLYNGITHLSLWRLSSAALSIFLPWFSSQTYLGSEWLWTFLIRETSTWVLADVKLEVSEMSLWLALSNMLIPTY